MARNNKMLVYKKQVELAAWFIQSDMIDADKSIAESVVSKRYSDAHGHAAFRLGLEKALVYVNRVIASDVESSQNKEKKG